jgi:hypothetical protein
MNWYDDRHRQITYYMYTEDLSVWGRGKYNSPCMCMWDHAHNQQIWLNLNLEATLPTELKMVITDTIVRT